MALKKKKIRVLSIDGGGAKGYFTAYAIFQLKEEYNINLLDYFDVFVGTSTGAIIVAYLLSGVDPKDIYKEYSEDGSNNVIFSNRKSIIEQLKSTFYASYDDNNINELIIQKFGGKNLREFYKDCKKDFLFCATNFSTSSPIVYTSPTFKETSWTFNDKTVYEAIRSTIAAPFVFEPFVDKKTNNLLLDGGLWANNPSTVAINLLISNFKYKLQNIEILSFGNSAINHENVLETNKRIKNPLKTQGALLFMAAISVNQTTQEINLRNLLGNDYHRYSPKANLYKNKTFLSTIKKVDEPFIKYTHDFWEKNKAELVEFITKNSKNDK